MLSLQQKPAWGLLDAQGAGCAEWLSCMCALWDCILGPQEAITETC